MSWGEMERLAYGKFGLTPDEFWAMTPREFALCAQGYRDRMDDLAQLLAWSTANLLNAWTEDTIQPRQLMQQLGRQGSRNMSREEYEKMKQEHGWD